MHHNILVIVGILVVATLCNAGVIDKNINQNVKPIQIEDGTTREVNGDIKEKQVKHKLVEKDISRAGKQFSTKHNCKLEEKDTSRNAKQIPELGLDTSRAVKHNVKWEEAGVKQIPGLNVDTSRTGKQIPIKHKVKLEVKLVKEIPDVELDTSRAVKLIPSEHGVKLEDTLRNAKQFVASKLDASRTVKQIPIKHNVKLEEKVAKEIPGVELDTTRAGKQIYIKHNVKLEDISRNAKQIPGVVKMEKIDVKVKQSKDNFRNLDIEDPAKEESTWNLKNPVEATLARKQ